MQLRPPGFTRVFFICALLCLGMAVIAQPIPTSTPEPSPTPLPTITPTMFDVPSATPPPFDPTLPPPTPVYIMPESTAFVVPPGLITLNPGDVVEGVLTQQTPYVEYTYQGYAGEIVVFELTVEQPMPLFYVDSYAGPEYVYDALPHDAQNREVFTITRILTQTRPYVLRIDATGQPVREHPYRLRRINPQIFGGLTKADTAEGYLTSEQPIAYGVFFGGQGELISIRAKGDFAPQLRLIRFSDDPTQNAELIRVNTALTYNPQSIDLFQLPATGEYGIVVEKGYIYTDIVGNDPGTFQVEIERPEPVEINYGDVVSGELTEANPIAYYAFEATTGDVISARVTAEDSSDLFLSLFALTPNFYEVTWDDDGGDRLNPEINRFVLFAYNLPSETQRYVLRVRGVSPFDLGKFTLELEQEATALEEGVRVWRWNNKGLVNTFYLDASQGEEFRLNLRVLSGANTPIVTVLQRNAQLLRLDSTAVSELSARFRASEAGRVLVQLDSPGRYIEAEISVERLTK